MRVVLDTNTLISALLFGGYLSFLVDYWQDGKITVLVSSEAIDEFLRVLKYPKFKLNNSQMDTLIRQHIPYATRIETYESELPNNFPKCRDTKDQVFLELSYLGQAESLISGDTDLLVLNERLPFVIETPSDFKQRFK